MVFTEFKKKHKDYYNIILDDQFLTWLIGFFEGDGSLVVTNRGEIHFVNIATSKRFADFELHKRKYEFW